MAGLRVGCGGRRGEGALDATGAGTCSLQDFAVTALGAGVGAALGGVYVYHYRGTTVVAWSTRF